MPQYRYVCEACKEPEAIDEKLGSPREHPCPKCGGKSKRRLGKSEETVFDCMTPGKVTQIQNEDRSANLVLTKLRMKTGKEPIDSVDAMALERYAGRKNKVVPGSKGESV
jgi:DNA-directed RNA polymerase subunit RPC12/RpoP